MLRHMSHGARHEFVALLEFRIVNLIIFMIFSNIKKE